MLPQTIETQLLRFQRDYLSYSPSQQLKGLELIRKLQRTKQDEALRFFLPNAGQQRFIDEIARPQSFICINASGNGGGKTYGLISLCAAIMWPDIAPECFKADIFRKWPYPKRLRIASTPKELEDIGSIQTTIKELFPAGRYEPKQKGKSYASQFISDTGFVLDLFSYEQDAGEMAGPNLGLVAFNEPPPEDLFKEAIARTRRGGIIPMAMTSLGTNPWVVDGLLNKANGQDIRVIYSDIEENCREHGKNGTLEHSQVEKILNQYDPDEREARKTGKPLSMSGRIFKNFDYAVHVADSEFLPPVGENISIQMIVDPAIGKPFACLWAWVDHTGVINYWQEYPETTFHGARDSGLTVKEYADIFRARERGLRVDVRILDRHFGNVRRTAGGLTLKQEFDAVGIEFQDSYACEEEVETGIHKVRAYLDYDKKKPIDAINRPRIRISPNCKNMISAFRSWGRKPETGKPLEEFKDFMDLVRYHVMSNPEVERDRPWDQSGGAYYGVNSK